jgi:acetoin utilization deacetylase AcuC-like enzyme
MGFCIFNNIAIAAKDALASGLERVMVIDYDAHHGNGTQAAFLDEDRAAFLSAHQWGIYPGTGWITDAPHAKKRIVNVPLPAYAGDQVYEQVADRIFKPFVESFKPQMLFISVGFDAHWNDPITMLGLSTQGYLTLARKVVALAEEHCDGKIVFVLEGGYDPLNVANGAEAVFIAATGKGESETSDPQSAQGTGLRGAHRGSTSVAWILTSLPSPSLASASPMGTAMDTPPRTAAERLTSTQVAWIHMSHLL